LLYEASRPDERHELIRLAIKRITYNGPTEPPVFEFFDGGAVYFPLPRSKLRTEWLPNSSSSKNFATCVVVNFAAARKRPKHRAAGKRFDPRERAIEWLRQLEAGEVASRAALARREGLSRARVSQALNQTRGTVAGRQRAG
jgi:hypothetical protein